ncbi:uncharacterized protein LOC127787533 [Diospyros lotus]|uniref:uncharacterized protein LOC127787533 n=1 Tax=Diospyros lotus TaxID=55363 RepID=UPI00225086E9|nr:uncharacterized protein LOC127787533 [Diospyros lotus]
MDHRHFLPHDHNWRQSRKFDGKPERREKPHQFSGSELLQQLEVLPDCKFGKHPNNKKRKRTPEELNWTRKPILFELPYWSKLKLRHNLDVMHIEKNICDNIVGTLLNIEGKTKDTFKARLDLQDLKIRKELHLQKCPDGSFMMPPASYTLSKEERNEFCEFLQSVKFPDGYASNISRTLGRYKGFVRNRAHPEGSIAKAYISTECLTFCSMYLAGIETRFNREEMNDDKGKEDDIDGMLVFSRNVRPFGASKYDTLTPEEFEKMTSLRSQDQSKLTEQIYALACGPDNRVRRYSGCIVNGVRFHTKEHETNLRSQNSGVVVGGMHEDEDIDFYGVVTDIIELNYIKDNRAILFKCDWFDLDKKKKGIHHDGRLTSINVSKYWYKDDPFVMALQAKQVFYLVDLKLGKDWRVPQNFSHRHIYDVPEMSSSAVETEELANVENEIIYQDIEISENSRHVQLEEEEDGPLIRNDVIPDIVNADILETSIGARHDVDDFLDYGVEDEEMDAFSQENEETDFTSTNSDSDPME